MAPISARLLFFAVALAAAIAIAVPAAALAAPSATTNPATKVHHTSAVLNGHLDPDSDAGVTECKFEWGETVAYGDTAPCNEGNAFGSAADVSASLGNLTPGATYHFRLHVETTSSGPFDGANQSFRPDTFPITHPEIGSFGPDGTSGSSFPGFVRLAFNQSARTLFALDGKAGGIFGINASSPPSYSPLAVFDPLSVPGPAWDQSQSDVAVDSTALASAGNVYYVSNRDQVSPLEFLEYKVFGYDSSGSPLPGFPVKTATGRACGAAVDSAGHLWLANTEHTIEEFSAAGAKIGSVDTLPNQDGACSLAFDSNDDMYVMSGGGQVFKYTAASGYTSSFRFFPLIPNANVAVDTSTHHVYVSHYAEPSEGRFPIGTTLGEYSPYGHTAVDEYDSAGHFLGESDTKKLGSTVAVDSTNHNVFFGDGLDGKIHVLDTTQSTTVRRPTVTTGNASAITGSAATLSGAVDPEGFPVTECVIEWGASDFYDHTTPCNTDPGSGSGDVAVSIKLSGLNSGTTYHFRVFASNADGTNAGKDVSFTTNFPPSASASPVTNVTTGAADLNGLVNPKGFATTYRFEWGPTPAYGNSVPVPDGNAGSGEGDVVVGGHLSGLAPNTRYYWRLVAESLNGTSASEASSFLTLGAPVIETTGAPVRTTESAQLGARVSPRGFATSYFFEYGSEGPCDSNPCTQTASQPAGSGELTRLVSEELTGLAPNATYHYRVVADNGQPGTPVFGNDMTVTTRSSEAPLSHGHFPGPPGSDRAWEQVSPADTGGNPVNAAVSFSADGNRALFMIAGGTPISETANLFSVFYAERTANAWKPSLVLPPHNVTAQGVPHWKLFPDNSLSTMVAGNRSETSNEAEIWRLTPGGAPSELFNGSEVEYGYGNVGISEDGSRLMGFLEGSVDPEHPASGKNLYDLTSGTPRLVGLLPDGSVPPCGSIEPGPSEEGGFAKWRRVISTDGSLAFFMSRSSVGNCGGVISFYLRDLNAGETRLISTPPVSGPECDSIFISSSPDAAFFFTKSRLSAEDTAPSSCSTDINLNGDLYDGDVYRYDLADKTLKCVTCTVTGQDADVYVPFGSSKWLVSNILVSEDGSRVYFQSPHALVPGAATTEGPGSYYRVNVNTGDLAWVAGPGLGLELGSTGGPTDTAALTPDGATLVFKSSAPFLNPLNGAKNGGKNQTYRYDDRDRSLACVSCPSDGSAPLGAVGSMPVAGIQGITSVSDDGNDIAFTTPTPLVGADQNTPPVGQGVVRGADVYEWRDGRHLLITSGLETAAPGVEEPEVEVSSVSADGRDLYFIAPAQYTPDALDSYRRLYDARIGGGFEYPKLPPPCPLEVCQGTPKGAPEEQAPGTGTFAGPGNVQKPTSARCAKGKARRKGRCVTKKSAGKHAHKRANHNRGTAR